jgi:four helix bundle protein
MENSIQFNHEKLEVYQISIQFAGWISGLMESIHGNRNIIDQIDRACISVSLNIAEGNGKSSKKDHNRFLEIAKGSALECAACLDIMFAKQIISMTKLQEGKAILLKIVRMLYKLSSSILGSSLKTSPNPNLNPNLKKTPPYPTL